MREVGTRSPHDSTAALKSSRSSARCDHVDVRADQLDPELVEHARLVQLAREVERGLAAHRRQQRVGPLAAQHVGDALEVERLEVGAVGEARGRS